MSKNAPPELVKREFAKRLSARMLEKGWNQSELARQAELHMPQGKKFNRDNASNYTRGKHLPGPLHLRALCAALRCEPTDLLPTGSVPSAEDIAPPLDLKDLGDGTVFVRINQRLPWDKAIKILNIAKGDE